MRVSKADESQTTDLQRDARLAAGVDTESLYEDRASGKKDDRPQLAACVKALRHEDTLVVWKLDRLGRDLRHLVNIVRDLTERGIGLKVLTGRGAANDTTAASGKLVFGIFAALTEFERELISERTLAAARARGRNGGRPHKLTPAKLRLARRPWASPEPRSATSAPNWDHTPDSVPERLTHRGTAFRRSKAAAGLAQGELRWTADSKLKATGPALQMDPKSANIQSAFSNWRTCSLIPKTTEFKVGSDDFLHPSALPAVRNTTLLT